MFAQSTFELDCHFIREKVQAGIILPLKISTKDQLADIFTKDLGDSFHMFQAWFSQFLGVSTLKLVGGVA